MVSELDYAIVHAVQLSPRVPWTQVAASLGMSERVVARRWDRLVEAGEAWVAPAPGPAGEAYCAAFALVRCQPGERLAVADRLAELPEVASIDVTVGDWDLQLDLVARSLDALGESLMHRLEHTAGLQRVETALGSRVYREGSKWELQSLDPEQMRALRPDESTGVARQLPALDDTDRLIISVLMEDGRMAWSDVGNRCDVSPQTAQRRIARLQALGVVQLRTHVSWEIAGYPLAMTFLCAVPSAQIERSGLILRSRRDCRLVAAVVGRYNLFVHLWMPSLDSAVPVEQELAAAIPDLQIIDRLVVAHTRKRLGTVLDVAGRRIRQGPQALW